MSGDSGSKVEAADGAVVPHPCANGGTVCDASTHDDASDGDDGGTSCGSDDGSCEGGLSPFVTRNGSTLYLEGKSFRFAGPNIHYAGMEYGSGPTSAHYPTTSSVDAGFAAAAAMHATAVRAMNIGISVGCTLCVEPALGQFNDAAFDAIDYAVQSAKTHHVRLIVPFPADGILDADHGWIGTFTGWRALTTAASTYAQITSAFYGNATVIQDYENYIAHYLNHINKYSGVAFKDDPTIMLWETGNEMWDPQGWGAVDNAWTQSIAAYIKSIAPHQLVEDGHYSTYKTDLTVAALQIPNVDVYTAHYYHATDDFGTYTSRMQSASALAHANDKAFLVGEYDWTSLSGTATGLQSFLAAVETSTTNGDTFWSLVPSPLQGDQFTLYYPPVAADAQSRAASLSQHASNMAK